MRSTFRFVIAVEVSTASGSDRVSTRQTTQDPGSDPVATALVLMTSGNLKLELETKLFLVMLNHAFL